MSLSSYITTPSIKTEIDDSYFPNELYFPNSSQQTIRCEICGEFAIMRHFGAYSCNACAAFFRRTVASQRTYFCRRGKNCPMISDNSKRVCRFCRFQKCIKVGMRIKDVKAKTTYSSSVFRRVQSVCEDSLLQKLVLCRRAVYFNRLQVNFNKDDDIKIEPYKIRCLDTLFRIAIAEIPVFQMYLHSSGLLSCLNLKDEVKIDFIEKNFKIHSTPSKITLCKNIWLSHGFEEPNSSNPCESQMFLQRAILDEVLAAMCNSIQAWLVFEMSLSTLRNGGLQMKRIFTVNERYFEANEDNMLSLYMSDSKLKNKDVVARLASDYYQQYFHMMQTLHSYRFDEAELTVLKQLMLITLLTNSNNDFEKCKDNVVQYRNQLFEELKKHYETNYEDVGIRMGNLILMLAELRRFLYRAAEQRQLLRLNGRITVPDYLEMQRNCQTGGGSPRAISFSKQSNHDFDNLDKFMSSCDSDELSAQKALPGLILNEAKIEVDPEF